MTKQMTLEVMDNALLTVPVWYVHSRAKNWAAIVESEPSNAYGVHREFLPYGGGPFVYHLPMSVQRGTILEFAGDHKKLDGGVIPNRHIGIVTSRTDTRLKLRMYETISEALQAKARMRVKA